MTDHPSEGSGTSGAPDPAAPFRALTDDEARRHPEAYAAIVGQRAVGMTDLYRLLMHAPDVAVGWCGLGVAIRQQTSLDDALRELVICLVAHRTGSAYELAAHEPIARRAGVTDDALAALPDWTAAPELYTDAQQRAFRIVACVLEARFEPDVMRAARELFDDSAVLEIAATAAYYLSISALIQGIGFDGGNAG